MTGHLDHDPMTKQRLKHALYHFLYTPVEQQFAVRLKTIVDKNCMTGGFSHRSFVYRGVLYNVDTSNFPGGVKRNRLVPSLHGEMNEYIKDKYKIRDEEMPLIMGFLNTVLNSSNAVVDYLKLLPEAVHKPIRDLAHICPSCPEQLTAAQVEDITNRSKLSIMLLRERMVRNLLISL